jgi:hypothetical protein
MRVNKLCTLCGSLSHNREQVLLESEELNRPLSSYKTYDKFTFLGHKYT